ncbi:Solute:Sodium symporter family [Tribonema minus]|uniref:Solute:Sodium symporter family n=1 Tax=Tribonema minus TaxID=303371 RepID=A0A835Z2T9_9STRA|nr:Solute:Sodium symporter family [Tribonema minus]
MITEGLCPALPAGEDGPLCCQHAVCNIPCPADWQPRASLDTFYGSAVVSSILLFCMTGIVVKANVRGMLEQYFVAGRGLGLLVTTLGLAAQCIDSNALLGTVDAAYKYNFWDGAVIPIGLTASLVLNGLLLAKHINAAHVLTLPDFYARTYGPLFEVLVSLVLCTTFICVLAGNLVGLGRVLQFCYGGLSQAGGVAASALLTASYTMGGGLKSVVYTGVLSDDDKLG